MTDRAARATPRPQPSGDTASRRPEGRIPRAPVAELRDFRALIELAERGMGVTPISGRTRPRPGY